MRKPFLIPMVGALALMLSTIGISVAAAPDIAEKTIVENRAAFAARLATMSDRESAIHKLAANSDAPGLVAALEEIEGDSGIDSAVRDHLLEATLLGFSASVPDAAARATVERFAAAPVNTFVRLTDEHGEAVVPLYDLAAAARLTLRQWDVAAAEREVANSLHNFSWQPRDFVLPPANTSPEVWQAGTVRALASADMTTVRAQKAALLQAHREHGKLSPALLAAARRLGDAELYRAVIEHGDERSAREAVRSAAQTLRSGPAVDVLLAATERSPLASGAILQLGEFISSDDNVRSWLLARLGDPADGASAALALARAGDSETLSAVRDVVLGDADELGKLRAVLVLRLRQSPSAQALRTALRSHPLVGESLREALR